MERKNNGSAQYQFWCAEHVDASLTRQYCIKTWKNVDLSLNMPLSGYIICIMASYHGRLRLHLVLISVQLYWFCQHCDWTSVCMFFFFLSCVHKQIQTSCTYWRVWIKCYRWPLKETWAALSQQMCQLYQGVSSVFIDWNCCSIHPTPLILWFKHFSLAHLFQGLWLCTRCCSTFSSS